MLLYFLVALLSASASHSPKDIRSAQSLLDIAVESIQGFLLKNVSSRPFVTIAFAQTLDGTMLDK